MGGTGRKDGRGGLGNVLSGLAVAVGFVLFLGGFVWGALLYQPYTVPTDSMMPTVKPGDRVLAERIDGGEVHRGDVVIFRDALWSNAPMVKRVVGVGGDVVKCCGQGGRLTVNGKQVDEPYLDIKHGMASEIPFEVTVPEGKLFLLGDRRGASLDSRAHLQEAGQGTVPRSAVTARVDAVAWPSQQMVERPAAFAAMPGGVSTAGPVKLMLVAICVGAVLVLGGAAYGPVAKWAGRRRTRQGGAGGAPGERRERAGVR